MTRETKRNGTAAWLGSADGEHEAFNGGRMWIGRHTMDEDLLVFDPEQADPTAERLTFFSLGALRNRTFPRAVVARMMQEVADDVGNARIRKEYERREELKVERDREQQAARATRARRQREQVLAVHRAYVEGLGVRYAGISDAPPKRSRRRVCHACGIALDDYFSAVCGACQGVLCSCGSCACGSPVRGR